MPIRITERESAGERGTEHNRTEQVKRARLKERIVVERAQVEGEGESGVKSRSRYIYILYT